jgi:hypothetical protein
MMAPFVKIPQSKKNEWEVEYIFARDLHISGEEFHRMPLRKIKYFIKLLKEEKETLEKNLPK